MKLKQGTAVLIQWDDAKSLLGWSYNHETPPRVPGRIKSLGFLTGTSKECISISHSMDQKSASLDDLSIPIGCITSLEVLPEKFSRDGEKNGTS